MPQPAIPEWLATTAGKFAGKISTPQSPARMSDNVPIWSARNQVSCHFSHRQLAYVQPFLGSARLVPFRENAGSTRDDGLQWGRAFLELMGLFLSSRAWRISQPTTVPRPHAANYCFSFDLM